jgi:DNA polymerase-3 subunit gamma/tau
LAKAINCLDPVDGNPCNTCTNCTIINEGTSLDYVEIDAASHTGVDNIREEILDKALYPPTTLKKKIYVIDEVHMLSKGAFNSLLKTIEEPKGNVCFILATTEIHKVPDTIVSRCQVFNFKKVSDEEIIGNLAHICDKEGFSYDQEALALIATISDGGVRDSVKYLDQVSIL